MAFAGCAATRPKTMPRAAPKLSRDEAQEPWIAMVPHGASMIIYIYINRIYYILYNILTIN